MRVLGEVVQDLQYAVRGLVRERGFATVAILTLALGIGANSAAFALVKGVLLAPLPYEDPGRLVAVWEQGERGQEMPVAWPNFQDWRRQELRTISGVAAWMPPWPVAVLGGAEPMRASLAYVSADLFGVLGVAPALGRTFAAEERVPNGRPAVIVSDGFWRHQLGGERDLSRLKLDAGGASAAVVGVMPASFNFPAGTEIWYPADLSDAWGSRSAHNFQATARLAAGASLEAAQRELSGLARHIRQREPESDAVAITLRPLHEQSVGTARRALLLLLGASALVLLVACTNLASALLARAARRRREFAVRSALGGHRLRLIRQLLTESLLLSAIGAVAGLLLAHFILDGVRLIGPEAVPRLAEVTLDGWVIGFATLLAVSTTLTFGIVPAMHATMAQPFEALRDGGRGGSGPRQRRAWSALIGAEVALALLLAVGSGLLIRSFLNVIRIDPGFDSARSLAVAVDLPEAKYGDGAQRVAFYDRLLERLAGLHGVEQAAVTMALPIADRDPGGRFEIEGGEVAEGMAHYRVVSPGFFEALSIPIVEGRAFTAADRAGALDVIIVNEALAQRYFPNENPIGRRITTGGMDSRFGVHATIVGVVGNVRHGSLTADAAPGYYLPYMQRADRIRSATVIVRARGRPERLAEGVRGVIREMDADVALEVSTVRARVGETVADRRFTLILLAGFALVALALAAVGIYGVVAYAVAQRTQEIGIRLALGAEKSRVLWLVGRSTMLSAVIGIVAGLAGAAVFSRLTAALLYETSAIDPLTFAAVALILLATASLAMLVPGMRAVRISPMSTLRPE